MDIFQAIVLGIIQGIGEFLPISSSAHLIIVPYLFNWSEHSLAFDIALHFGTLIAVLSVFWQDWLNLFKGAYDSAVKRKKSFNGKMFWYIVAATIPGALVGKLFESQIESVLRNSPVIIALALGIMGIAIYLGDKYAERKFKNKEVEYEKLTLKQTFLIGISQAFAVIPGFSRSGTTILTARLMGVSREAAAKFTFLLSVPVIFGATVLKFDEFLKYFSLELIIGVLVSAIVGILSIKFLLKFIKKNDFAIFGIYRIVLALIVLFNVMFIK
ncbi:MAG: undecaprenyl-diphosphatase UppP [Clostridia bacterium]|nr:undecaprenyl-diphosphatase UppP [Clostridia bacterium]